MRTLCFSLLALAACSDDPPPASDADACTQLEMGPYMQITATVSRDQNTATVADDGSAYTVTLTQNGFGYVRVTSTGGKYVFYLDRGLVVNALEGAGTPAALSSATSSDACGTIKGRHEVTLGAGDVYFGLMADGGAPVNLVLAAP